MSQVYDFIGHTVPLTHILCCQKHHKPFLFSYQLSTPAPSSRILPRYLGPDINLGISVLFVYQNERDLYSPDKAGSVSPLVSFSQSYKDLNKLSKFKQSLQLL